MLPDKVELLIAGKSITAFSEYSLDSDLYVAADAFSLTFGPPRGFTVMEGLPVTVKVNGKIELTGLVDDIEERDSRNGSTLTLSGRDLMGLVVDAYAEEFIDLENITLKAAADRLLKPIPFINRKTIVYQKGSSDSSGQQIYHLDPGTTVFEALKALAMRRELLFYCQPDGTFVFGKPLSKGEISFHLRMGGQTTNCKELTRTRSLAPRYSLIKVLSQGQGIDAIAPGAHSGVATVTDATVPFRKVMVMGLDGDTASPARHARYLLHKQRAEGLRYTATVAGHSQGGQNWRANLLTSVDNQVRDYRATALIYGRTLRLSKEAGQTTELRLGLPGVLQ